MENQFFVTEGVNTQKDTQVEVQYLISENKFIFLSIISAGLYPIWWAYKAWRFYQQKQRLDIFPALRALFGILFLISLFERTLDFAKTKGYQSNYSPVLLFLGIIVFSLLSYLPGPMWLTSIISAAFFMPAFNALNFAKRNSAELVIVEQTNFNIRQYILIVIGAMVWGLFFVALYLERSGYNFEY